jgi:transposase
MLNNEYITRLINLQGVVFENIDIQQDEVRILVESPCKLEVCPHCLHLTTTIVDVQPKVYKDLDIFDRSCFIEIDLRRFECTNCRKTFTQNLSFTDSHRRYTKRFEEAVYKHHRESTGSGTGRKFGISDKTATDIYHRAAKIKQESATYETTLEIGIDEISMLKGHGDFVLVITDITNKRVLDVLPDKKKETLETYIRGWEDGFKAGIESVSIDMWGGYRSVAESLLPNAVVVTDRFHVMQKLNDALDTCRKQEMKKNENKDVWKHSKYALLKNQEDLLDSQRETLERVLRESPVLKDCYELKEEFRSMFNECDDRVVAKQKMRDWIFDVLRRDSEGFYGFIKTLLRWGENILNYFLNRMSSGFVEGVNNKIKVIKRMAFGFCNFENFRVKIIDCFG